MKNYEMVIVDLHTAHVYDFLNEEETKEEAEARRNKYYQDELELVTSHLKNYGGDYWEQRVEDVTKQVKSGCKLMAYDDFRQLERNHLLDGELTEITDERFDEMLNVLPPLKWCTIDSVEMFCMSEMFTGTYTSQYAHDKTTDKYYTKMVDVIDKSTWINQVLKEKLIAQ